MLVFVYDILVYSFLLDLHLQHLRAVLEVLGETSYLQKEPNFHFVNKRLTILGTSFLQIEFQHILRRLRQSIIGQHQV